MNHDPVFYATSSVLEMGTVYCNLPHPNQHVFPYIVLHTRQCADEDWCSVFLLLAALTTHMTHSLSWVRCSGKTCVNLILCRCNYQIIIELKSAHSEVSSPSCTAG